MSVNKVILVGNVGKDPEVRYLDEGTAMAKFPLATSETYKNKSGERVSTTEWHNVVLWRGLAQVAEKFVRKGTQIYIEGRIKSRSYDDADGIKKYITEIVGDQMQLLGKRQDEGGEAGYGSQGIQQAAPAPRQAAPAPRPGAAPNLQSKQENVENGPGAAAGNGDSFPGEDPLDPFDGADNGPDDLPF
jgi:single-strand DNA-binding protein